MAKWRNEEDAIKENQDDKVLGWVLEILSEERNKGNSKERATEV